MLAAVRRRSLAGMLAALVCAIAIAAPAVSAAPTGHSLTRVLRSAAARQHVPHAQAAIVRDGRVIWSGTRGRTRASDRFVLASVTKMVVATVVLRLVDQGRLGLDDPVARWIDGIPNGDRVTVRMLLAHRSGLSEYFDDRAVLRALADCRHRWRREELLAAIRRGRPESAPDARFAYRNTNYLLLGEIVERVTGAGVEAAVQREAAGPLGLGSLSFSRRVPGGGRLMRGHELSGRRLVDTSDGGRVPNDAIGPVWTDGGLAATARDVARFTDALLGGRLLAPTTLAEMTSGGEDDYGLGVSVLPQPDGSRRLGHDGVYGGYTAYAFRSTQTRDTVVVLTDLSSRADPAWRIAAALWRELSRRPGRAPAARP
jgi:D-alanyl-D-alanine carboxypeptidase